MFSFKNTDSYIIKTNEDKIKEKETKERRTICPNCGRNPRGGSYNHGIVFGSEDLKYKYITCTHCNCDYKYRR